jgi:hypothetical protein
VGRHRQGETSRRQPDRKDPQRLRPPGELEGAGGGEGKSWNWYDIGDGKWHQLWLDAQGTPVLSLAGGFAENTMKYEGTSVGRGGVTVMNRLQFFKLPDDKIRQLWEQSSDGGKSWTTSFDGEYRRRR